MQKPTTITTQEEARQFAMDFQVWVSEQSLSYGELSEWDNVLTDLARDYDLLEEFRENGIISLIV